MDGESATNRSCRLHSAGVGTSGATTSDRSVNSMDEACPIQLPERKATEQPFVEKFFGILNNGTVGHAPFPPSFI